MNNITVDNGNWVNFTFPDINKGENYYEYPADYDHLYENLPYDYEYEKEWLDHYDIDKIYVIGVI